jgi:hypothetical protein
MSQAGTLVIENATPVKFTTAYLSNESGHILKVLKGQINKYGKFDILGFNDSDKNDADNNDRLVSVQFVGAPVPEPETYAMVLAGLGLLGLSLRRRKNDVID